MGEEYKIPDGLYYTEEHEWARMLDDGTVDVSINAGPRQFSGSLL